MAIQNTQNITDMLTNATNNIQAWWGVIYTIGFLIGMIVIAVSIIHISKKDKSRYGYGRIILGLIGGIFLFNLDTFINTISQSLFQQDSQNIFSYSPSTVTTATIYFKFAFVIVVTLGLIAVIKGCLLLYMSTIDDPNKMFQAIAHLIGGTIAINILTFLTMIGNTVGGNVQTTIQQLLQ